jgi:hypothetical protein
VKKGRFLHIRRRLRILLATLDIANWDTLPDRLQCRKKILRDAATCLPASKKGGGTPPFSWSPCLRFMRLLLLPRRQLQRAEHLLLDDRHDIRRPQALTSSPRE